MQTVGPSAAAVTPDVRGLSTRRCALRSEEGTFFLASVRLGHVGCLLIALGKVGGNRTADAAQMAMGNPIGHPQRRNSNGGVTEDYGKSENTSKNALPKRRMVAR